MDMDTIIMVTGMAIVTVGVAIMVVITILDTATRISTDINTGMAETLGIDMHL